MIPSTDSRRFLVLIASARRNGNTEALARHAFTHVEAEVRWVNLLDLDLPDFSDERHATRPDTITNPVEKLLFDATMWATDIVVASPLYMYALSTQAKRYMDYWSGWGYVAGFSEAMARKTVWGVTVLSEEDFSVAEPLVRSLELSANWQRARFGGVLLGLGNYPGDIWKDTAALERATTFFAREPALA